MKFRDLLTKEVVSWALFDFANSSYSIIVISLLFSIYFRNVIAQGSAHADLLWGVVLSTSVLLGALAAPAMGAVADYARKRKPLFVFFSIIAILGTASLYFTGPGGVLAAGLLFIITNFAYENAIVLYDSFLVLIVGSQYAGRISGFGWALGYLGGIVAALLFIPLYIHGYAGHETAFRLTFPLTALFFLLFSIPAFLHLHDRGDKMRARIPFLIGHGFHRAFHTLRHIRQYANIFRFFIGYYLVNDGMFTLISFTGIFAVTTLGLPLSSVLVLFLIVHAVGFPATFAAGQLADKFGHKKILLISILGWMVAAVWLAYTTTPWMFYLLAVLGGLVLGTTQAVGRSLLSILVPLENSAELFGFNGFASKLAATLGPLVFGVVSSVTANQRIAVLSLVLFFVGSFLVLLTVKERRTLPVREVLRDERAAQ
ncbi:MAG TPA: MFS transporter [Candidatus Binatia bacterium]|nr:MFS transporter [Candidatus Binatia bacterium]